MIDKFDFLNDPAARYERASRGISKAEFIEIVHSLEMTITTFSELLPVSKRTLEKFKNSEVLSPVVSDRIVQLLTLFQFGMEVFGSLDAFKQWLNTPLIAMGSKIPFEFLDSDTGISYVKDILGRIEHGIYS